MKLSLKVTVNLRDDGGEAQASPTYLVKLRNADGDYWLVDAGRWSDLHRDGFVFHDRRDAEAARDLCERRLRQLPSHFPLPRLSVVEFKKGL